MVSAWYMDDSNEDQRKPHKKDPNEVVSVEQLKSIGVLYWSIPLEQKEKVEDICKERCYKNRDEVLTIVLIYAAYPTFVRSPAPRINCRITKKNLNHFSPSTLVCCIQHSQSLLQAFA